MNALAPLITVLFCSLLLIVAVTLPIALMQRSRRRKRSQSIVPSAQPVAQYEQPRARSLQTTQAQPLPIQQLLYTRKQYLLTRAECAFFEVLQTAVPGGWHIFPQVRLANLVEVARGTRQQKAAFNRIQAKCVDFVLCEPRTLSPRLVIELDDSSHNAPHRQARDAFVDAALQSAKLPILHVRWQPTYSEQVIAAQIQAHLQMAPMPIAATPASTVLAPPRPAQKTCDACLGPVSDRAMFCRHCGNKLQPDPR